MHETALLKNILDDAQSEDYGPDVIGVRQQEMLALIVDSACSGRQKAALAVTITLLLKKIISPEQDIRLHQSGMSGGFSGRTMDSSFVTPFLSKERFPCMQSGSGWLTRSFEQARPYNRNYPGKIRPPELKQAFLGIVGDIQKGVDARLCLSYLLHLLVAWRDKNASLTLARPTGRRIEEITGLVEQHWMPDLPGIARLPVLATYAAYKCLVPEVTRYKHCRLQDLQSHTSADLRTDRIGDIDVFNENGKPFEAVEIKHRIAITAALIRQLREKIAGAGIKTYYVLSTNETISASEMTEITALLLAIRQNYGCQVIVNGVATTIKYYLRLMADTDRFVDEYVSLVEQDQEIPFDLKRYWNEIIG